MNVKKYLKDFHKITSYYDQLVEMTNNKEYVGINNEWIIDNYYLIVEHKNLITDDIKGIKKILKDKQRIIGVLRSIIIKNDYSITFKKLVNELNNYQKKNEYNFSYEELEAITTILAILYNNKIKEFCIEQANNLEIKKHVENIIQNHKNLKLKHFDITDEFITEPRYIFEINNQLKALGEVQNEIVIELSDFLAERDISLKELLNKEYHKQIDDNNLISNLFNNLKSFMEYDIEEIYKKISKTERLLLNDKIYKRMTVETKKLYRNKIKKVAKFKKISEYDYVEKIFDSEKHIGMKLFKQKNYLIRKRVYVSYILIMTILLSLILSKGNILGFILLLFPMKEIIGQVSNTIISKFTKTEPIPKMNYSKGIPNDSKTMIVIPTIIKNKQKIKEMFDTLETFYIVNKSNNLYFTLIGDCSSEKTKEVEFDSEIVEYGKNLIEELNKKYNKRLFNFVYRNRFYNESEGCYLGFERKRGALLQFNHLILGKYSVDEKHKWFRMQTLDNFNEKIKYVITLDADTKLLLNSALNLVGAMDHPLNKPIYNKNHTKIVKGYALLQPKVSVDIEATNKSLYSQIVAGIGGFDTYAETIPNFYQDVFKEGSFVGKGIYNVEIFDNLLYEKFPDNRILSHDLLEGCYLRCGYVSDIEFVDDFPSKFLSDTSRHHRWARGDTQIIGWLFNKIENHEGKKINNPLDILGKYKIFDNIARMFLYPSVLLLLILSIAKKQYIWLLISCFTMIFPIFLFISNKLYFKRNKHLTVYYRNLKFGGESLIINSFIALSTLPYYTNLYMNAFFKTMYRLLISKKNLLNWITAEEAEKTISSKLSNYIKNFKLNIIIGSILLFFGPVGILFGLSFISAPFILCYISRDLSKKEIKKENVDEIKELSFRTWRYFQDNLKEEFNYLIPDNYQENRENLLDTRTSPTNIGFSLLAVISAYKLDFISYKDSVDLIEKITTSIEKLEKWNGHLFNWYNIKTLEKLNPAFVSTVDSGNLVASLIIAKQFVKDENRLYSRLEKLIKATDFKKLYTDKNVFSIGYDEHDSKLSVYNYNSFASESRITSYVSIALGCVPNKHWFCLDKSLTAHNGYKGVISWSGTSFEYYMPLIYMKNYPNTLLDESYEFAYNVQKDYVENIDKRLPWGISESAYDELDDSLNYKYKTFSTPKLKLKEDINPRLVISPYSSLMAIELHPNEVIKNVNKFKKLDMYSDYGLYESYDYETKKPVRSYFAHHQGMILCAITNYLKDEVLKELFMDDVQMKTYNILLKEKVQLKTNIDMKMAEYKKYNYNKETIYNDIRVYNYISDMPEISMLSNQKYTLLMNDRGSSFSRYRTIQLNRYRKITEQDYGMFMYIKDLKTNKVWSNTYAPVNEVPDDYEVVFASDQIKYKRVDDDVITKTKIIVCKEHHAEIRKITFINNSKENKTLELTTYTEPIISNNMDDISHRVFNNMFIRSEYDPELESLIMVRKSRNDNINNYMVNKLFIPDNTRKFEYETERSNFIGRNRNTNNPLALNQKLSNKVGTSLDPIMSLRNRISIKPGGKKSVYFICGYGKSKVQINEIINSYNDVAKIKEAFKLSSLHSIAKIKSLNITGEQLRYYNIMLNYLYQTTKIAINNERLELLKHNALTQSGLWKFGISGDRPIISIHVHGVEDLSFVNEMLKVFEYYKLNSIFVDVVFINSDNPEEAKIIKKKIDEELYRIYSQNSFNHVPGNVTVIDRSNINDDEMTLLNLVPRLNFDTSLNKSLKENIEDLQKNNSIYIDNLPKLETNELPVFKNNNIEYFNSYGGFINDGKEYEIINSDTPAPWTNVIANKNFGTIITNNGCGFTYCYNSGEYKITSWTNDVVLNDKSEGININDKIFNPTKCIHGFGYSILSSESKNLKKQLTEFVAKDDNVKLYLLELENKLDEDQELDIGFWINPTLGNFEEKTSRHILSEYMENDNYLKMRNVYSLNYSDAIVFMSSSEKIDTALTNRILLKTINVKVNIKAKAKKTLAFSLGCTRDEQELLSLKNKYSNLDNVINELDIVKKDWEKTLGVIKVKTNDESFNYVMNGWYLYQTLSSRIMAKAGYYQVSGAFGYRDQLQDSMNISFIKPDLSRKQLIINASHQFMEGDVLHWWHEQNHFGLRSRYKDDFLWLVYATVEYVQTTGDYAVLDEQIPFVKAPKLESYQHELGVVFEYTEEKKSLLDHCILSIEYSKSQLGSHGIPLMGGGDWNDGMNLVGIKGKGESVWLGFFLYNIIDRFIELLEKLNMDTSSYVSFNKKLKKSLNENTWDGDYYLRAFFDNGDPLGSHLNDECKIDLISQSFSILSDVVPNNKKEQVIGSVEKNLVDKENNIIKLLDPPFEKSKNNPGYIMNYPKGIRENGGQYTHSTSWYIMALIKAGLYDKAYEYYQMINPVNRTLTKDGVLKYKVEPYVIAADIYSNEKYPGHGGWTWYTGSSGWFYKVGIKHILGIHKLGDKLEIKPGVPSSIKNYVVDYKYMDTNYNITVNITDFESIIYDDKEVSEIKLVNDMKDHIIVVNKKRV